MAENVADLSKRELERRVQVLEKEIVELTYENRFLVARRNTFTVTDIVTTVAKCGTLCFLGVCLYWTAQAYAGKETSLAVLMNVFFDARISTALAWLLAVLTGAWAVGERNLRIRRVRELSRDITQLEQLLDTGRTSSQLTD